MSLKNRIEKVGGSISSRKGLCVVCGERVYGEEKYIEADEGYCHRHCLVPESSDPTVSA